MELLELFFFPCWWPSFLLLLVAFTASIFSFVFLVLRRWVVFSNSSWAYGKVNLNSAFLLGRCGISSVLPAAVSLLSYWAVALSSKATIFHG
ncbi:hypothetical protein O6P43_009707 [Quillaja saponaria]|uniref:Uncharacterized protein n=1 Tax=Quillaja saponaria TaxID=32244 RepID=A0AAD7PYW1_QUISA|nr:hypothetical protein O6P43_009707 [Quillaja saponaria]